MNGTGEPGYLRPCPPTETHDYNFHLYALKQKLDLSSSANYEELKKAMEYLVLEQATLKGTYHRA